MDACIEMPNLPIDRRKNPRVPAVLSQTVCGQTGGLMRVARFVLGFLLVFISAPRLNSQQTSSSPQRDPQAIALAQQSLGAMGGSQALSLGDSLATGQVQSFRPDGTSATFPIVEKSLGTTMIRTEFQRPEGTRIRIVNGGIGAVQMPDGTIRSLVTNNTVMERIEYIPALSFLCEFQNPSIEIQYAGTDTVSGRTADVVRLSYVPTSDANTADAWRLMTRTFVYIDQATKFVSKIQYQNFAENDTNLATKVEVVYSDYRSISGVMVPFTESTFADGQIESTLYLKSVRFNNGLLDAQFALPTKVK
jgi:hypothetical protein